MEPSVSLQIFEYVSFLGVSHGIVAWVAQTNAFEVMFRMMMDDDDVDIKFLFRHVRSSENYQNLLRP